MRYLYCDFQVKLANNIPSKKNSKEPRKIDDRSAEHVLKSLSGCNSTEEKLSTLCKKYAEVAEENKKMHSAGKQWEKKYVVIMREKDQIQSEYNKTLLFKCKLENLCRELQRQIKTVKVSEEKLHKFVYYFVQHYIILLLLFRKNPYSKLRKRRRNVGTHYPCSKIPFQK